MTVGGSERTNEPQPQGPIGLLNGLQPEKIAKMMKLRSITYYVVKYKYVNNADIVRASDAIELFPRLVCEYLLSQTEDS